MRCSFLVNSISWSISEIFSEINKLGVPINIGCSLLCLSFISSTIALYFDKELPEEWWKYELRWYSYDKVDGTYNTHEEACEELKKLGGSSFDEKDAM